MGMAEGAVDGVDGVSCGLGGEVPVDVGCGGQGGVPQRLGDHREGDAGGDGDGRRQVAQVVDGDAGDIEVAAEVVEVVENVGGVEGLSIGAVEDVTAVVGKGV
jgi:hypothetical protein